jgi:hypothetical protein
MAQSIAMPLETGTADVARATIAITACVHGRLINDVLSRSGKRTGKVYCVECGAKFDDPYHGLK